MSSRSTMTADLRRRTTEGARVEEPASRRHRDLTTSPAFHAATSPGLSRHLATFLVLLAGCSADETPVQPEPPEPGVSPDAAALVERLDFDRFKANIEALADFGDREQGTTRNAESADWIEARLEEWGYEVQRHGFTFEGAPLDNVYATKVGTSRPDQMYIVSAHFDGRGGGGAADDDASGCALVLEMARVFAESDVGTDVSVRFIFWNAEEVGLIGSSRYVAERASLQGLESPQGSGRFPEPTWLGMVQHDMILFDHGLPPRPSQNAGADIDVEYQAASAEASASLALARALAAANPEVALSYPAQVGSNMRNTDSWPFRNFTAAVSVRENRRIDEIGQGANPHWHRPTDLFATYSEADFRLGFDAVRTTAGAVATLTGVRIR